MKILCLPSMSYVTSPTFTFMDLLNAADPRRGNISPIPVSKELDRRKHDAKKIDIRLSAESSHTQATRSLSKEGDVVILTSETVAHLPTVRCYRPCEDQIAQGREGSPLRPPLGSFSIVATVLYTRMSPLVYIPSGTTCRRSPRAASRTTRYAPA